MPNDTVMVACKLPGGLFLDSANAEATPGLAPDKDQRILLNGANAAAAGDDYGVTEMDAGFVADWMARHRAHPLVRSGSIFVLERDAPAEDQPAGDEPA